MAKKTVATLQTGAYKKMTKVIKMVRSPRTGTYTFEETIVSADKVEELLS